MDYAMKNGVSLSTLRRYIKAGKIRHKSEHGKYFILDESAARSAEGPRLTGRAPPMASKDWITSSDEPEMRSGASNASLEARVSALENDLKQAQEEIAELKMLVAIYEERIFRDAPSV